MYLWHLSRELALTCGSVTAAAVGGRAEIRRHSRRRAQRAYQDGLAETNQATACSHVPLARQRPCPEQLMQLMEKQLLRADLISA